LGSRPLDDFRRPDLRLEFTMRTTARACTGIAIALGAALACSDVGPESVEGSYALESLNDSPLPYDNEGLGCCWYLAGTLTLTTSDYTISITARNFGSADPFAVTEWGTYTRAGATLTFAPDSFDMVPLLLSPATASGDAIELGLGGEGPGEPDQFQARFEREQ
jgi:hypothetical protein